jgi:hypothetical protein
VTTQPGQLPTRGPVHWVDAGSYRAVIRDGVPMIERESTGGAVLEVEVEPVARSGDKIQIHCPECAHLGTHLGTCSWSQMRSGRLWVFHAEAVEIQVTS